MKFAILKDNKVVNIIEADPAFKGGVASETAAIGDFYDGGLFVKPTKPELPEIVLTSLDCSDTGAIIGTNSIICKAGALFSITAEIRKGGVKQLITDYYRMPLRARDGRERITLASFVNGAAVINSQLSESGFWSVTEAAINEGVPEANRFKFAGLTIDTYI